MKIPLPAFFSRQNTSKNEIIYLKMQNFLNSQLTIKCEFTYKDEVQFLNLVKNINLNLQIYGPSRAELHTTRLFAIVLSEKFMSNLLLPFNMLESPDGLILFDYAPEDTKSFPVPLLSDKEPYDSSYWSSNEMQTVLIPWLPYFSHCQGHGRHIILYDLLESEDCTIVKEDKTKVVNSIPINGFSAVGDKCNLSIKCWFEETVTDDYTGTKWWDSSTEMFYITSKGLTIDELLYHRNDNLNNHYSLLLDESADDLIPVTFKSDSHTSGQIPDRVTLVIKYQQISQREKYIISAEVRMSDYKDAVSDQASQGNSYQLEIKFNPMNYLDLINQFCFELVIYLFLFSLLGILTIFGIMLFWLANKLLSKIQYPPQLKIKDTIRITFWPTLVGSFIGSVPFFMMILLIYALNVTSFYDVSKFFYKYDKEAFTEEVNLKTQKGRCGLMLTLSGFFFLYYGSQLIIAGPSLEQ